MRVPSWCPALPHTRTTPPVMCATVILPSYSWPWTVRVGNVCVQHRSRYTHMKREDGVRAGNVLIMWAHDFGQAGVGQRWDTAAAQDTSWARVLDPLCIPSSSLLFLFSVPRRSRETCQERNTLASAMSWAGGCRVALGQAASRKQNHVILIRPNTALRSFPSVPSFSSLAHMVAHRHTRARRAGNVCGERLYREA